MIIPALIFGVLVYIQQKLMTGIYRAGIVNILALGPLAFYVGVAISYFNEIIYTKFGLDEHFLPISTADALNIVINENQDSATQDNSYDS